MVVDIPSPNINPINDYGTEEASLEDRFYLDATGSGIFESVPEYKWKIVNPSGFDVLDKIFPSITTPIPSLSYNIANIKGATDFFNFPGIHTLSLTIGAQTESINVDVQECIPFAGTGAPYPYHTVADPFKAEHRCCDAGNFKPQGVLDMTSTALNSDACFTNFTIAGYKRLITESSRFLSPATGLSNYPVTLKYVADDDSTQIITATRTSQTPFGTDNDAENDIFSSTFERLCSGDRGNICSGEGREIRQIAEECEDLEYSWQTNRCEGPPVGVFKLNPGCEKYTGTTFEFAYGIVGGSQKCSGASKCTDALDFRNDGKFQCSGAMCKEGECSSPSTASCKCEQSCNSPSFCSGLTYNQLNNGNQGICRSGGFCTSACDYEYPDDSQKSCETCDASRKWNPGGSETDPAFNGDDKCCGNNPDEYYITSTDGTQGCCDTENECVISGVCQNREKESRDICNNIDDDCNGHIDDINPYDYPLCSKQFGVCQDAKKRCGGSAGWLTCTSVDYGVGYEPVEASCDDLDINNMAIDNDCDGWANCEDSDCSMNPACIS